MKFSNAKELDIVIPAYGDVDMTMECIRAVRKNTHYGTYRIIVVNNSPELGSEKYVGRDIFLIENQENLGFVKAANQGIATSTAKYVCMLNNDAFVPKGWTRLLRAFNHDYNCGVVGPLMRRTGDDKSPKTWQEKGVIESGAVPDVRMTDTKLICAEKKCIAFFCAIINRKLFADIGYLSEAYGQGYGEDDEFCLRAAEAGWNNYLDMSVTVDHVKKASFGKLYTPQELKQIQESSLDMFRERNKK